MPKRGKRSIRAFLGVLSRRRISLADIDPVSTPGTDRRGARRDGEGDRDRLHALQQRLYAEDRRSLLLVLQGMDTSGKDGTIEHVIGQVDPHGVHINAFRALTAEEKRHDFLWRIKKELPAPREIGIFVRSHYEDVLVVRV